jgi:putative endonuclease
MRTYDVYILASVSGVLYTGVTSDLKRRVWEHRHKLVPGFTSRYNVKRLLWWESTGSIHSAIAREKQVKNWRREKKLFLIRQQNAEMRDLSAGWYE